MVRQERAEATRDSVLRGAAGVFLRLGYANASLSEIIAESQVTKGALYFHFGSKEELARAVIDEGSARFDVKCELWLDRRTPALEALIGISSVIVDVGAHDDLVRATFRLLVEIGDYKGSGPATLDVWFDIYRELASRAAEEGDLRSGVDSADIARLLLQVAAGVRLLAAGTKTVRELSESMKSSWNLILPVVVPDSKVEYFRQFADRRLASEH
ncbi:AcrR family transcriptional regulator [Rhodococcus sp. 27YEA15]|uniref:ScbR family autoregulator-binding transcription factor n=1 Tax=Rhodococcus sp. 27YEA15 TaxID=3156259 RepID=UPI003C7BE066